MTFRVIWQYQVLHQVAASFVYARQVGRDAGAITRAMAQIDTALERNPAQAGESRDEGARVLIINPLTVFFEVHEDEQTVIVFACRYHRRDI